MLIEPQVLLIIKLLLYFVIGQKYGFCYIARIHLAKRFLGYVKGGRVTCTFIMRVDRDVG